MHSEPLAKRLSSQEYGRVYISLLSQKRKLDTAIWVSFFHAVLATLRPILEREKLATHPDVGVLRFAKCRLRKNNSGIKGSTFKYSRKYCL